MEIGTGYKAKIEWDEVWWGWGGVYMGVGVKYVMCMEYTVCIHALYIFILSQ